jgi:hypothetical protein
MAMLVDEAVVGDGFLLVFGGGDLVFLWGFQFFL